MSRAVAAIVAGLIVFSIAGVYLFTQLPEYNRQSAANTSNSKPDADNAHDHSKIVELQAGPTAPTLDFSLDKDAIGGWNLHISTTNFRFAPENVNRVNRPGEGHAHIYVNEKKLARIYSPWFHISELPTGTILITVTLNSNDHSTLSVGKKPLSLTKSFIVR